MRQSFVSFLIACLMTVLFASTLLAQTASIATPSVPHTSAVPALISYSGVLKDVSGHPLTSITGVTFLIYQDQQGGAPLWLETQTVTPDLTGLFTVELGAASAHGLPADLFQTNGTRWLAVQVANEAERARTMLVAVPYAMKAADAETVGGLPPSAFVLAAPPSTGVPSAQAGVATSTDAAIPPVHGNVTGLGTVNTIPLWDTTTDIVNSAITQAGSGATARIGINTTTPAATLDVKGAGTIRGALALPSVATATTTAGSTSQPLNLIASSFNSSTHAAVNQTFRFQSEPAGNNTTNPSATLNLLYASGGGAATETGWSIAKNGLITFAPGQTFPGTGTGSVSSVGLAAPAGDFIVSGSPVTTSGTLKLAWNVPPDTNNTANAIVKRDASGNFSAGTINTAQLNATNVAVTGQVTVPTANSNALSASSASSLATTIYSTATSTSGEAWGVEGATSSGAANAYGVFGYAGSASGAPIGVYGLATSQLGVGTFGQIGTQESTTGAGLASFLSVYGAGVWGDGGIFQGGNGTNGVVGTTDKGWAGFFANNSDDGDVTLVVNAESSQSYPFYAFNDANSAYCNVDNTGNLNCSGAKHAVVTIDGGKRKVALSAIESPVNWFEDAGSARLVNGVAVVQFDPDFIQTVNTEMDYKVFPVPNGDCKGLYVTNKTATSFEVRELGSGTSSVPFDYRIMVVRRKYENVRFEDHTNDPDPTKQMRGRAHGSKLASHDPVSKPQPLMSVPLRAAAQTAAR